MSEGDIVQNVLILSRLVVEASDMGGLPTVSGVTHDGRSVQFLAEADQSVNVKTLEFQQTPVLVLVDQLLEPFAGMLQVPARALLSVVPMASGEIQALLDRGEGDALLRVVREQLS
ncbi:MAG: hypothetical protein CMI01_05775 [Oceanospirillaceae bacterium]|nr:hypothetical protein [Oceanospirillaceae bacterium]